MGLINVPEMGCLNRLRGRASDLSRSRLDYVVRTLKGAEKFCESSQILLMITRHVLRCVFLCFATSSK